MQSMDNLQFCDYCGAANTRHEQNCVACQETLSTTAPAADFVTVALGNGVNALKLAEPVTSHSTTAHSQRPLLAQRYMIMEEIGEGGFGIVYKAQDTRQSNKLVAIKQINLAQLSPRDIIQATDSYNRETTLLPKLKHKNLPYVYDYFTDPEHWYIVMDFITGETLEEYLKHVPEGKLPVKEVIELGKQLCDVLAYLHGQHQIVFRDVKPANIMRTATGQIYLIDFGIARRYVPGKTKDTTPLGSPGYAAPEQYGTYQSSPQTDIYGLGATLQTLLTGKDPSEDKQDQHTHADSEQDTEIPTQFQSLLNEMLAWDMAKRPESIAIVRWRLNILRSKNTQTTENIAFVALLIISSLLFLVRPNYTDIWSFWQTIGELVLFVALVAIAYIFFARRKRRK